MTVATTKTDLATRAAAAIAECRLLATMTEEPGRTTRRFLTPPMVEVHAHLRSRMESLGMTVTIDAAGNLRGLWQPPSAKTSRLLIGSHVDTVPAAGAFDGVLGVVLALELVRLAQASVLPLAMEVIAFSEEEGVRFGVPFLGSRAVAGRFDPALLALTDAEGISLATAIRNFSLDPGDIEAAAMGEESVAFLEIHIEQGPVLEAENLSLGVVTAIVGQTRCELHFTGQANHAGTTPMHLRHDALTAAAKWIVAVEQLALEAPPEACLVATVGKIVATPNAGNVIPGAVWVSLDIRAPRDSIREAAVAELFDQASLIATTCACTLEAKAHLHQPAVPMDEELTALVAESIEFAGYPSRRMASGAGHDAMIMATRIPTAMLFLRSPGGISHHPNEAVLEDDVAAALSAGHVFLMRFTAKLNR